MSLYFFKRPISSFYKVKDEKSNGSKDYISKEYEQKKKIESISTSTHQAIHTAKFANFYF